MLYKFYPCILFCILVLSLGNSAAQDTTSMIINDTIINTVEVDTFIFDSEIHSPARAAMLSAAVPGLGQIYNKKYWKVPIIYLGGVTLIYFIDYNNDKYKFWRDVYYDAKIGKIVNQKLLEEKPYYIDIPIEKIETSAERNKEAFRKYREYCIMGVAALYLFNIIDANIDAYFLNFDVSKELVLKIRPSVNNSLLSENIIGVKLSLDYK